MNENGDEKMAELRPLKPAEKRRLEDLYEARRCESAKRIKGMYPEKYRAEAVIERTLARLEENSEPEARRALGRELARARGDLQAVLGDLRRSWERSDGFRAEMTPLEQRLQAWSNHLIERAGAAESAGGA